MSIVQEPTSLRCLVYIGLPENPQFLGPQDPDVLARRILDSRGPSGENREYLFNLDSALAGLSRESGDAHVADLVRRCRVLLEERHESIEPQVEVGTTLQKSGSGEEQEEVEK